MAFILRAGALIGKGYYCSIARRRASHDPPNHRTRCEAFVEGGAGVMGKKRKFANIERVSDADAYYCPACTQKSLKWLVFSRHLQRCCPDLLSGKDVLINEGLERPLQLGSDVKKALQLAAEEEDARRQQLVSVMPPPSCSAILCPVPSSCTHNPMRCWLCCCVAGHWH